MVYGYGFMVYGYGFMVHGHGLRFMVKGSGFGGWAPIGALSGVIHCQIPQKCTLFEFSAPAEKAVATMR